MTIATLDTLAVAKELKAAGFTDEQAEAVARAVRQAQDVDLSSLATKADLQELRAATKADLQAVRSDMNAMRADIIKWTVGAIGLQYAGVIGAVALLLRLLGH